MKPFDNIIGYRNVKDELLQIIDMLKNREVYEGMGAKLPRGVLLSGEPGMGKTLLATSFMKAANVPVFEVKSVKAPSLVLQDIHKAFENASKESCAIVFFDDVDKFSSSKGASIDDPAFVAIQSGIDSVKDKNVLVLATANNVMKLPTSLLRNGRFDRKIHVGTPKGEDAEKIVEYYLRKRKVDPNANYDDISKMINYSSCADLDKIVNESAIIAAYKRKNTIDIDDVTEAYIKDRYGVNCSREGEDIMKVDVALHEAGHCVVAEVLKKGCVGIVSTRTSEGFTKLCASLDRRPQFILMSLAGKVAYELYREGRCASGCSDDLTKAVQLIREGLTENGNNGVGLLVDLSECNPSDSYKSHVEASISSELERYLFVCRDILIKNKGFLFALTKELYVKHTLLHSDVQRIRSAFKIVPCPSYSEPEAMEDERGTIDDFLGILDSSGKRQGKSSLSVAA